MSILSFPVLKRKRLTALKYQNNNPHTIRYRRPAYNRAGIFQGAYTEDDDKNNIPSTYNLNFRNFAVGIPGTGGSGTDDVPGLTPGIVQ